MILEDMELFKSDELVAIINGEIDIIKLAKQAMAARGQNEKCAFIGFDKAKKRWGV